MKTRESSHVALVTGGGRGIGAAIARRLAQAGAAVLVASRDEERCARLCVEMEDLGGIAWPLALDVTEPDSVAAAVARGRELARELGPLAWLVNDAGIAPATRLLPRDEARAAEAEELHERALAVNYAGARRVVEAVLPDMLARGYGRIVNVASSAALRGYTRMTAYCASKHALLGYSRAAALELEDTGVALSVLCPHFVDSPLIDEAIRATAEAGHRREDEVRAEYAARNPGGRLVTMDEVAEAALALLESGQNGLVAELDGSRPKRGGRAWKRVEG